MDLPVVSICIPSWRLTEVCDVLYAEDMAILYFPSLARAEQAAGQAFNIGGGIVSGLSLLGLFRLLEARIGQLLQPLRYRQLPPRSRVTGAFSWPKSLRCAMSGWQPQVLAVDGVLQRLELFEGLPGQEGR